MVKIKKSEARILIYLSQVDDPLRYAQKICWKLQIEYNYVRQLLGGMYEKGWVEFYRRHGKVFYKITPEAPLNEAKELMGGSNNGFEKETQKKLENGDT